MIWDEFRGERDLNRDCISTRTCLTITHLVYTNDMFVATHRESKSKAPRIYGFKLQRQRTWCDKGYSKWSVVTVKHLPDTKEHKYDTQRI